LDLLVFLARLQRFAYSGYPPPGTPPHHAARQLCSRLARQASQSGVVGVEHCNAHLIANSLQPFLDLDQLLLAAKLAAHKQLPQLAQLWPKVVLDVDA
jgi:hypothetical protein